jgi:transposase
MAVNYREILRLSKFGLSYREIAVQASCSLGTVSNVLEKARMASLNYESVKDLDDMQIKELLYEKQTYLNSTRYMPDYEYILNELNRKGVTKQLLWNEYVQNTPNNLLSYRYSRFCSKINLFKNSSNYSIHIERMPGEIVEVDWAGTKFPIKDPITNEQIYCCIFVATLSYSNYCYVEAFYDEKLESWINGHINAYNYFGGTPLLVVCDNLKTGVINYNYLESVYHKIYLQFHQYYNTAIMSARIRKPTDKPNVERTIRDINTWLFAKHRNDIIFSLEELNNIIRIELDIYLDQKSKINNITRREAFEFEKPHLGILPENSFTFCEWFKRKVNKQSHINIDKNFYSVPQSHIGEIIDVKVTNTHVECYLSNKIISSHSREFGVTNKFITDIKHIPVHFQHYISIDNKTFEDQAASIGEYSLVIMQHYMTIFPLKQQYYRYGTKIINLAEKYGHELFEQTCSNLINNKLDISISYIERILKATGTTKRLTNRKKCSGIVRGNDYYSNIHKEDNNEQD